MKIWIAGIKFAEAQYQAWDNADIYYDPWIYIEKDGVKGTNKRLQEVSASPSN